MSSLKDFFEMSDGTETRLEDIVSVGGVRCNRYGDGNGDVSFVVSAKGSASFTHSKLAYGHELDSVHERMKVDRDNLAAAWKAYHRAGTPQVELYVLPNGAIVDLTQVVGVEAVEDYVRGRDDSTNIGGFASFTIVTSYGNVVYREEVSHGDKRGDVIGGAESVRKEFVEAWKDFRKSTLDVNTVVRDFSVTQDNWECAGKEVALHLKSVCIYLKNKAAGATVTISDYLASQIIACSPGLVGDDDMSYPMLSSEQRDRGVVLLLRSRNPLIQVEVFKDTNLDRYEVKESL